MLDHQVGPKEKAIFYGLTSWATVLIGHEL
jgi:hypothetical protein